MNHFGRKTLETLNQLSDDCFHPKQAVYIILIKDLYMCPKNQELTVNYQCTEQSISGTLSLTKFMQSPLKHATHPNQLLQLGIQVAHCLADIDNTAMTNTNHRRCKRVFYTD